MGKFLSTDQRGTTLMEFSLLAALIALVAVSSAGIAGSSAAEAFKNANSGLNQTRTLLASGEGNIPTR